MPFRPQHSLLRVDVPAISTIDTSSVENLFGMWSLFRSASHAMEDGRRLENLSWRLWTRETFCCDPRTSSPSSPNDDKQQQQQQHLASLPRRVCLPHARPKPGAGDIPVPDLSSSLDSASSSSEDDRAISNPGATSSTTTTPSPHRTVSLPRARPELRRAHSRGTGKHITPVDLEKMVISIKETKEVATINLPRLPNLSSSSSSSSTPTPPAAKQQPQRPSHTADISSQQQRHQSQREQSVDDTPVASHPPTTSSSQATLLQSSASTLETSDTKSSQTSETIGSPSSSSTEMSGHSIVRGFVPGGAPSSYRSQTNLATSQPTPILKTSPKYQPAATSTKKKGAMFTIGTSSGEEESSLDSLYKRSSLHKSSLSESLKRESSNLKKSTAFGNSKLAIHSKPVIQDSAVFESDDEDEEVSESAIEDDDDSSDWEDSDEQSGPSSVNDKDMFQRVDSRPNLTSRRSLLTSLMHEPDRAKALANAASRSSPALRRSRQSTPNGPSVATSPEPSASHLQVPAAGNGLHQHTPSKPIIMTTSNTHQAQQLALSPRTTRRNMLSTELTESLRKNLLWERQHKSTGNLAALRRRNAPREIKNLRQPAEPGPVLSHQEGVTRKFSNEYFHQGLGEYHYKGW